MELSGAIETCTGERMAACKVYWADVLSDDGSSIFSTEKTSNGLSAARILYFRLHLKRGCLQFHIIARPPQSPFLGIEEHNHHRVFIDRAMGLQEPDRVEELGNAQARCPWRPDPGPRSRSGHLGRFSDQASPEEVLHKASFCPPCNHRL